MKNSIRVERAVLRISQQELADRVGVSRQTINAIESCRYIPSGLVMMKIAFVFQKSVNDIFALEESICIVTSSSMEKSACMVEDYGQ